MSGSIGDNGLSASRAAESKAPNAFRTISEVAANLDVPQHVLRFWESKFQQVRPLKRGGGRRYYRPEDVVLLSNIKELLYNQGFTIRGVQKLLKETGRTGIVRPSVARSAASPSSVQDVSQNVAASALATPSSTLSAGARREVENVLAELKAMRELLFQNGI